MQGSDQVLPKSKILIVDDIKNNRTSLARVLDVLDIEVIDVDCGEKALVAIQEHEFAIILMDVCMPGMDGYETASLIHTNKAFANVPIVMVTTYADDSNHIKAYESGAVDFIAKPVEPVVLINKVQQFVEFDRQRRLALLAKEEAVNAQEAAVLAHQEAKKFSSKLEVLLECAGDGIIGVDREGFISFANPKSVTLLNSAKEDLIGRHVLEYVSINKVIKAFDLGELMVNTSAESEIEAVLYFIQQSNQTEYRESWVDAKGVTFYAQFSCDLTYDDDQKCSGAVIIFQDVSEKKQIDDKLLYLASFDPLTQIANRFYFRDALDKAIARCKRTNDTVGLLFLDLDHFKYVNDHLGHDGGDQLLQTISQRIKSVIRKGDLLARIGGDEFAVILHEIKKNEQASMVAAKILKEISAPITIQGQLVDSSVSIGISILDETVLTADELVQSSDTAMYEAKKRGRNNYQFFEREMQEREEKNSGIQIGLQKAIVNDEFKLMFQPKVSCIDKSVIGCEVLLRWTAEGSVAMSPAEFIPVAENSGQIIEIGTWVFRRACEQLTAWQKNGQFIDKVMSINVSAMQLTHREFDIMVTDILEEFDIEPQYIELEITETSLVNDFELANKVLNSLHDLGVAISIDDFGTGYSSLDHLRKLPVDVIKIDQSFIKDIGVDKQNEELVTAMLAVSKAMGLEVIAEGVETEQQMHYLVESGCDFVQGYLFSKPLDRDDFESYLNTEQFQILGHKDSQSMEKPLQ